MFPLPVDWIIESEVSGSIRNISEVRDSLVPPRSPSLRGRRPCRCRLALQRLPPDCCLGPVGRSSWSWDLVGQLFRPAGYFAPGRRVTTLIAAQYALLGAPGLGRLYTVREEEGGYEGLQPACSLALSLCRSWGSCRVALCTAAISVKHRHAHLRVAHVEQRWPWLTAAPRCPLKGAHPALGVGFLSLSLRLWRQPSSEVAKPVSLPPAWQPVCRTARLRTPVDH